MGHMTIAYTFRGEFYIYDHMMLSIRKYIENRSQCGDFLSAVICNDLKKAVSFADETNLRNLPAYVGYFYNEAPSACWGSPKKMKEWLKK